MITHVFIDGFNLYNGIAVILECKWVDLFKYLKAEFPEDDVRRVVFATSWIKGDRLQNQEKYVKALQATGVEVVFGKFESRICRCDVKGCSHTPRDYSRRTEKRTDVTIAAMMVEDAALKKCEKIVVVSADSDFIPALEVIKGLSVEAHVLLPVLPSDYWKARKAVKASSDGIDGAYAEELRKTATGQKNVNCIKFAESQFEPEFVIDSVTHKMPGQWKVAPNNVYPRMLREIQRSAKQAVEAKSASKERELMAAAFLKSKLGLGP